ncbi:alpha/beta fold hydrolase [Roseibium sp. RKSG952]|uniref:alpha/beta fold hydrolase n=1 Tax=Roseibium sp. RKSG952 TaxID=2529384 RepID=UPI0012BB6FAB|nr:alpha/beta fold hydrolase [Roseibium sp. RKSG952]MTH95845.1 alpha/beta fold hydrolase [Roseibium sp. RKSG952]
MGNQARRITAIFALQVALLLLGPFSLKAEDARQKPAGLYEGETLTEAAGYPVLYRYIPADKSQPLLVFIPGDAHLARIFYGYPGGRPEDFISHWVTRVGHPFLAISYPMSNPVFEGASPDYNITDWGNQVAEVVAQIVSENGLTQEVIICGWSMGGKIAAAVGKAAKDKPFAISAFVAMSADPPVPGFLPRANAEGIKMTAEGYADRTPIYDWFFNAVGQQNAYNGHTIIPKDIYEKDMLGAIPVALIDTGLIYKDNKFIEDTSAALRTGDTFDFSDYPFPVVIHDNSPDDPQNVLLDTSDWAFIRNRVLIQTVLGGEAFTNLTWPEWERLQQLVATSGSYFTEVVEGNHFYFIGSAGARSTVEKILQLHARVQSLPNSKADTATK